jgi:hypothetical protein
MTRLSGWENFYVILGSSAGALIGLQFVVVTLVGELRIPDQQRAGAAFATPTVVHFSAVLLLSALVSMPWSAVEPAAVGWGVVGAAGAVYTLLVTRRMREQQAYRPQIEDWLFHSVFPCAAYVALVAAAVASRTYLREALFTVAASAVTLLFVGIHNAWDAVTYHVFVVRHKRERGGDAGS